jgi:hypothetical protein
MVVLSTISLKYVLKHRRFSADNIVGEEAKSTMSRFFSLPWRNRPLVDQGALIIEASRWHSFIHTKLGRTPPDELPDRRRKLYLTMIFVCCLKHMTICKRISKTWKIGQKRQDS